jgi:hypothetical protein
MTYVNAVACVDLHQATKASFPVMAQTRNAGMSPIPPLLGDKRTSRGEPIAAAIGGKRDFISSPADVAF